MEQHHRDAIEGWAEHAAADDDVLAVVAGSLTKGYGRADSDVDGFVVITDGAFARRRTSGELTFFATDSATTRVATSTPSTSTGHSSKPW